MKVLLSLARYMDCLLVQQRIGIVCNITKIPSYRRHDLHFILSNISSTKIAVPLATVIIIKGNPTLKK